MRTCGCVLGCHAGILCVSVQEVGCVGAPDVSPYWRLGVSYVFAGVCVSMWGVGYLRGSTWQGGGYLYVSICRCISIVGHPMCQHVLTCVCELPHTI